MLQLEEAKQQEETGALYELLQRQRADIRSLLASQQKLRAELESVQSELLDQRRQNQQLRYQILTLRKLRSAERAKQHKSLEQAELRLEKELEKYLVIPEAAWQTSTRAAPCSPDHQSRRQSAPSSKLGLVDSAASRTLSAVSNAPQGRASRLRDSLPGTNLSQAQASSARSLSSPPPPAASQSAGALPAQSSFQLVGAPRTDSPAQNAAATPLRKTLQLPEQSVAPFQAKSQGVKTPDKN